MKKKEIIISLATAVFIFIFLYTAINKLAELDKFRVTIVRSPLIGNNAAIVAWLVPVVELVVCILLFFPRTRGYGLLASLMLWVAFTLYIAWMLVYADRLPCSCGGFISSLSWQQHLALNISGSILAAIACRFYFANKRFIAINRSSRTPV